MCNTRKIIHIDMDAFFASIEQKDHVSFRGKPLIVGGSPQSRGVVAACSYEARKFGIHSAMPCSKAVRLCPEAIFTPPRMGRYVEISNQIMGIFRQHTDLVEPLSLDEAFLDVTHIGEKHPSATLLARHICQQIYQELQLTASAGISYNKFLAKVASDINKPHGITTIPPKTAHQFLDALPIRKFFGVGQVTEKKMRQLGINTGSDLKKWDAERLVFHFGKIGSFLHNIVRGIDDRPVEPVRVRKSIGSETTLPYDTDDLTEINKLLAELADDLEKTLLRKNKGGYTLTLKVRYKDFTTITRSITVRTAMFSVDDFVPMLPGLLAATQVGTVKIRLLGLSISKLVDHINLPRQLKLPFMYE
ncbi:MAG: DNA polymerase IV [Proteobacteria bacterium]|nr:DNA polymerase IV [Pseudomonadota bacterium]